MPKFKISKENKLQDQGSSFIEAGIHEDLEFDRITYNVSANGNKFLAFYLKDLSGAEVSKTEWEPKDENPEKLKNKVNNQMIRIHHILVGSGVLSEINIEADDFEEFANKLIDLVGDKYKDVKIRAKVVYDDNNYTTLPNYTKYIWIEPMSVPKEKSKIRILGIDRMERIRPDDTSSQSNPFESVDTSESEKDNNKDKSDLPF